MTKIVARFGTARLVASAYFIALALLNAVMMIVHGDFGWSDCCVLAITPLPLLLDRDRVYRIYGLANCLLFTLALLAVFTSIRQVPWYTALVVLCTVMMGIVASLILFFSGMYGRGRDA